MVDQRSRERHAGHVRADERHDGSQRLGGHKMTAVAATFADPDFDARVEALAKLLGRTREEVLELAFTSGLPAEEARLRAKLEAVAHRLLKGGVR